MPLNVNHFNPTFKDELMFDPQMVSRQREEGYCFSALVTEELARLDERHAEEVNKLSKQMADILNEFTQSNPDRSDPQVAAKKIFNALNNIPALPELATLKKLLIQNIKDSWSRKDWGFHNEAASSARFDKFSAAFNQLIFPSNPRIAAESKIHELSRSMLFSPSREQHRAIHAHFDLSSGIPSIPLPERSVAQIIKATQAISSSSSIHFQPLYPAVTETNKTWGVQVKTQQSIATIRCENDTRLTIDNLDPNDKKMVNAYIQCYKAMVQNRGFLTIPPIMINHLSPELAVALALAAEQHGIRTTLPVSKINDTTYKIGAEKHDISGYSGSHKLGFSGAAEVKERHADEAPKTNRRIS